MNITLEFAHSVIMAVEESKRDKVRHAVKCEMGKSEYRKTVAGKVGRVSFKASEDKGNSMKWTASERGKFEMLGTSAPALFYMFSQRVLELEQAGLDFSFELPVSLKQWIDSL